MLCWYYEKKDLRNTASIRDGLDFDIERRYRREGVRFIMECGTTMGLGNSTIATGAVYFHRFYMFHTFREFPRYVTACCCLFLAGKVEETPKKCRDIISTARTILHDPKFQAFSEDQRKAKEEVMTLESILLQTIKFDLQIEHPYGFLIKYAKCLKGDQARLGKIVQMAWNFVNDSLTTTVCLQWEPEIVAVALIHLASKLKDFTVKDWTGRQPTQLRWWDMFIEDVTMEVLEDICHQILDIYQQPTGKRAAGDSPTEPHAKMITTPASTKISSHSSPNTGSPIVAASAAPPQAQMPVATKTSVIDAKTNHHRLSNMSLANADKIPYNYMSTMPNYGPMYAHPPNPYPGAPMPMPPMPPQPPQSYTYAPPPPMQPMGIPGHHPAHPPHAPHQNYYPPAARVPPFYPGPT